MVERVTSNDEVAGSIPSEGIEAFFFVILILPFSLSLLFLSFFYKKKLINFFIKFLIKFF